MTVIADTIGAPREVPRCAGTANSEQPCDRLQL